MAGSKKMKMVTIFFHVIKYLTMGLISKWGLPSDKKKGLSVSLPVDLVNALKEHHRTKTGVSDYVQALIQADLDSDGFQVIDGKLYSPDAVKLLVPEPEREFLNQMPGQESEPVPDLDLGKKPRSH